MPSFANQWLSDIELGITTGSRYISDFSLEGLADGGGLTLPGEPQITSRYRFDFSGLDSNPFNMQISGVLANGKKITFSGGYGKYGTGRFRDYDWYGKEKETLHSLFIVDTKGYHANLGVGYQIKQTKLDKGYLEIISGGQWERMKITMPRQNFRLVAGRRLDILNQPKRSILVNAIHYTADILTMYVGANYRRPLSRQWQFEGRGEFHYGFLHGQKDWDLWEDSETQDVGRLNLATSLTYQWSPQLSSGIEYRVDYMQDFGFTDEYEKLRYKRQGIDLWLIRYRF